MSKRVLVPLARGFEETEAMAVIDVLRRADIEVVTAALESGPVESAHAVKVIADALLSDVQSEDFDAVVLPGGLEGTDRLSKSDVLSKILKKTSEKKKLACAICAAPTVFEEQGLLDGRKATCHFTKQSELKSAVFLEDAVVVDENVVTSRGVGTALAFGLKLVSLLKDQEKADEIARAIHFSS